MVKGIDTGNAYTKDESGHIFRSAMSRTDDLLSKSIKLRANGDVYYMGRGSLTIDEDKSDSEINRLCVLTCLAMSPGSDFEIVAGLPIGLYKEQRQRLSRSIKSCDGSAVSLNDGPSKIVYINAIDVYPQGAGALYSQNITGDALIVDVGGYTIDTALIEITDAHPELIQQNTFFNGVLPLQSKIIEAVTEKYGVSLELRHAEKILKTKELKINGEIKNISFVQGILQDHFDEFFSTLKLNYKTATTQIYLCGGGAALLYAAFKKRFPHVVMMENPQFANANGLYQIGLRKFGRVPV